MPSSKYMVALKDESGVTVHEVARDDVGDYINAIDWQNTYAFSVAPIEPLAQWEIDLLISSVNEVKDQNNV